MTPSRSETPSIRSETSSTLSLNPDLTSIQSIVDLVDVIKEHALTLEKHLTFNGLPRPSFDAQDAPFYPSPYSPEELMDARAALLTATRTLYDLVLGPAALLEDINVSLFFSVRVYCPPSFRVKRRVRGILISNRLILEGKAIFMALFQIFGSVTDQKR